MKYGIDLHLHTHYSDGIKSPADVVEFMADLDFYAIDHDTTLGIEKAVEAASNYSLNIISGIEFTTSRCDMLGLFVDPKNPILKLYERDMKNSHERINREIVDSLKGRYDITIDDIMAVGHGTRSDPQIAHVLYKKGYFKSFGESFKTIFPNRLAANRRRAIIDPKQAIQITHEAGGLAVLPHKYHSQLSMSEVKDMVKYGLDGVEVYHHTASRFGQWRLRRFAKKNGLKITIGSDYHGMYYPKFDSESIVEDIIWVYFEMETRRKK